MTKSYLIETSKDLSLLENIESIWKKICDEPQVKLFDIKIVAVWLLLQLNLETEKFFCDYYGVSYQKFRKVNTILSELYDAHSS